jgi:hypothetical protein
VSTNQAVTPPIFQFYTNQLKRKGVFTQCKISTARIGEYQLRSTANGPTAKPKTTPFTSRVISHIIDRQRQWHFSHFNAQNLDLNKKINKKRKLDPNLNPTLRTTSGSSLPLPPSSISLSFYETLMRSEA